MAPDFDKLREDAIQSIATYLTIAVPGTVIDLEDNDFGGSFVYDCQRHAVPPPNVRQSEARLVDGMMPIANIMIGSTSKSVVRSYSRALDSLVPAKATLSSGGSVNNPDQKSYQDAMAFLKTKVGEKSIVDIYIEKQLAWEKVRSEWDAAKVEAQNRAEKLFPRSSGPDYMRAQQEYFSQWNQENFFRYKSATQAALIDWTVSGRRYEVEYNFGIVETESIMARVEDSKQELRLSTIPDADRTDELYGVVLTSCQWATYCKRKAENWCQRNQNYTLGQLDAEIARLTTLLASYTTSEINTSTASVDHPANEVDNPISELDKIHADVAQRMIDLVDAQTEMAEIKHNQEQLVGKPELSADDKVKAVIAAKTAIDCATTKVMKAQKAVEQSQLARVQAAQGDKDHKLMTLSERRKDDVENWNTSKSKIIDSQINQLRDLRDAKFKAVPTTVSDIAGPTVPKDINDEDTSVAIGKSVDGTDLWTTISLKFTAADQQIHGDPSKWGMAIGGSVGFSLWSVGGPYCHDKSHSDMRREMASCDVSISFSALVVNIDRPWLYAELFYDFELGVAEGVKISPGPVTLKRLIDSQDIETINQYDRFPAYPTSFIIAADTTIEFTGTTKHIEEYFNLHSDSGNLSIGYGPWLSSPGVDKPAPSSSVQMHTTATGCKLTFGAPQVIAWVSDILPALPRAENFNPLTQGAGTTVSE